MSDSTRLQRTPDRNLLFGNLALQMDFISRDSLIAAMHAWVLDKGKPLGQILVEQGTLQPAKRDLLEALVAEGHTINRWGVTPQSAYYPAGARVPDLHGLILARRGESSAVGAKVSWITSATSNFPRSRRPISMRTSRLR